MVCSIRSGFVEKMLSEAQNFLLHNCMHAISQISAHFPVVILMTPHTWPLVDERRALFIRLKYAHVCNVLPNFLMENV